MEPKDLHRIWRVIGANVVAWIGAGIGLCGLAPEFGGDAFSSHRRRAECDGRRILRRFVWRGDRVAY